MREDVGRPDPLRLPVPRLQQPHRPARGLAPRRPPPPFVLHPYLPPTLVARLERPTRILNERRTACGDSPGIPERRGAPLPRPPALRGDKLVGCLPPARRARGGWLPPP